MALSFPLLGALVPRITSRVYRTIAFVRSAEILG